MNTFDDPSVEAQSPLDIRIADLRAEPWPEDSRRIRVYITLAPFTGRPNLNVNLARLDGKEVAAISIIESMEPRIVFTMHIRDSQDLGPLVCSASVVDAEQAVIDHKTIEFQV